VTRTISARGVTHNRHRLLRESPPMKCSSAVAVLVISAVGLVACADDQERTEGRYCTEVGNHLTALNSPTLTNAAEVDVMLDAWRTVADAAPLAVQPEWDRLMAAMETASTVDPSDAEAMQRIADTARSNEPSANKVIDYTFTLCGVRIGEGAPITTTTLPPTTLPASTPPASSVPPTTAGG
jgi:hypothetical protein